MNKIELKKVRRWLVPILLTFFVWGIFRWVLFVGYVPTESMEPTIPRGSVIVAIRDIRNIKPGNIIAFCHEGKLLVKRVTMVYCEQLILEGYYVLGDNLINSIDSRAWDSSLIKAENVIAHIRIIWQS